ncbi:hypothetical protein RMSM_04039 [Rhodopirellula maiorica SM1]|uniref:Uncharacterized protein n=1 Tax=Rhodopirellula maiorica SM1 TaxID=1265738 RepID=M5RIC1_9BACT|nr:hypothetical protein RMSM_04039 [Rhodopirellula maiorica SM1]
MALGFLPAEPEKNEAGASEAVCSQAAALETSVFGGVFADADREICQFFAFSCLPPRMSGLEAT